MDPSAQPPARAAPAGSRVRRNLYANYVGSGWSALASFLAVPLYIRFLGVEAYGLVGFFTVLLAMATVFQLGFGAALTRELARLSAIPGTEQDARDLSRTVELLFWGVSAAAGGGLVLLADWIAVSWLRPDALNQAAVARALRLMGIALALHWPYSLYSGGLLGLQRQVLLNGIGTAAITVRTLGAVLVLWLVAPTLTVFFSWQVIASLLQTALGAAGFWRSMPTALAPTRFAFPRLFTVWRFAAGVTVIGIFGVVLVQMDKIVVSRFLSLETLGYYSIASVAAGLLYRLGGPIFGALYPRMTQLVECADERGLARIYHTGSQLLAVIILPFALMAALFPRELLHAWTRDAQLADGAALLLALIVGGTALNVLLSLPYALQLAHGWTGLAVRLNGAFALLFLPLLMVLVTTYGAAGAALLWLLLNVAFIIVSQNLMHRRLLRGHLVQWYVHDVGRPLAAALPVVLLGRLLVPAELLSGWLYVALACVWVAAAAAALVAAREIRSIALRTLRPRAVP